MRIALVVLCAASMLLSAACSSSTSGPPCDPDKYEGNDTPATAKDLGEFTDDPDSKTNLVLSITTGSDVDFFRLRAKDRGLGGDPIVTVSAPEGYEVTTWFTCTTGTPQPNFECGRGSVVTEKDVAPGPGCMSEAPSASVTSVTDCDGTSDDDGTVLIRIRRLDKAQSCSNYDITIEVE
jgi:hypothetical protein